MPSWLFYIQNEVQLMNLRLGGRERTYTPQMGELIDNLNESNNILQMVEICSINLQ
jgi:hypothetical protein